MSKGVRVVHLQCFVVARALHVFADDQIVAQSRGTAFQNRHLERVGRQAVTTKGLRSTDRHAQRYGGDVQALLIAQAPNVIRPSVFEGSEIKVRLVGGRQDVVVVVAHQEHVIAFDCIAVITKRHQGAVFRQTRLCVGISSCSQHGASITRRDFTRFANQQNRFFCNADAPIARNRRD